MDPTDPAMFLGPYNFHFGKSTLRGNSIQGAKGVQLLPWYNAPWEVSTGQSRKGGAAYRGAEKEGTI